MNNKIYKPVLHQKSFQELTVDELYELLRVRSEVFVVEQNCVYQDMDGDDQMAIHLWLTLEGKIVALARVCPAGTHMKGISIGRVITTERGKGYGKQIMLYAIDAAKEHFDVEMERPPIVCQYSAKNNQCIGRRCPFSKANQ